MAGTSPDTERMITAEPEERLARIPVDTPVEVRSRFERQWCRGFVVAEIIEDAERDNYWLRRLADGSILPAVFTREDVAPDRSGRPGQSPARQSPAGLEV
jgi:hypothetical protein